MIRCSTHMSSFDIIYRPAMRRTFRFWRRHCISESGLKLHFFIIFLQFGTERKRILMFGGTQQALRDQNAQFQAPQKEKGRQVPSGPGQDGTHCRVNRVMAFVWLTLHSLSGPTSNKPIVRCWGSHRGRKGHLCLKVYSPVDKRHNSTNNDGVFVCLFWTFPPAGSFPGEFYSSFQTQLQHQLTLLAVLSQAELVARLYTECFLYQDPGHWPFVAVLPLLRERCSVVSDFLRPHGLYSPWNSPGQNPGVGRLSLLQWIFPTPTPTPGIKPRSPALQADSLPAEPPGKPTPREVSLCCPPPKCEPHKVGPGDFLSVSPLNMEETG